MMMYAPAPTITFPCEVMFHTDENTGNQSMIFARNLSYPERCEVRNNMSAQYPGRQSLWVDNSTLVILA